MCRCWGQHEAASPPGFCMGADRCGQISPVPAWASAPAPWDRSGRRCQVMLECFTHVCHLSTKAPLVPGKDSCSYMLPLVQELLILSFGPPAQEQFLEAKGICSLSVLRAGIAGLERNHRGSLSRTGLLPCQLCAGARARSWQECVGRNVSL